MAKNEPTLNQHNSKIFMKKIYKFENDLFPPLIDGMCHIQKNTFEL